MAETEPDEVAIPMVWVGLDDLPPLSVNQMVIQHTGPNEFVLAFGHIAPPIVLGSAEQRREQLEGVSFLAVKPLARVGFNRRRLKELLAVLQQNLERHDKRFGIEDE